MTKTHTNAVLIVAVFSLFATLVTVTYRLIRTENELYETRIKLLQLEQKLDWWECGPTYVQPLAPKALTD